MASPRRVLHPERFPVLPQPAHDHPDPRPAACSARPAHAVLARGKRAVRPGSGRQQPDQRRAYARPDRDCSVPVFVRPPSIRDHGSRPGHDHQFHQDICFRLSCGKSGKYSDLLFGIWRLYLRQWGWPTDRLHRRPQRLCAHAGSDLPARGLSLAVEAHGAVLRRNRALRHRRSPGVDQLEQWSCLDRSGRGRVRRHVARCALPKSRRWPGWGCVLS